jgi:hypothetical protein
MAQCARISAKIDAHPFCSVGAGREREARQDGRSLCGRGETKARVTMAQSDVRPTPQAQAGTTLPAGAKDSTRQMEGQAAPPAPQQGSTTFTDWASI